MYMFFLMWRFQKRLEHYGQMKGPFYGGEYSRSGIRAETLASVPPGAFHPMPHDFVVLGGTWPRASAMANQLLTGSLLRTTGYYS